LHRPTLPPVVAVSGKTELPAGDLRMCCNRGGLHGWQGGVVDGLFKKK
jgi:hypothetical protein